MLTVDHLHFREDSRLGIPIWLEFNLFLIIITPRHHRILNSMHESIEFPFFKNNITISLNYNYIGKEKLKGKNV